MFINVITVNLTHVKNVSVIFTPLKALFLVSTYSYLAAKCRVWRVAYGRFIRAVSLKTAGNKLTCVSSESETKQSSCLKK